MITEPRVAARKEWPKTPLETAGFGSVMTGSFPDCNPAPVVPSGVFHFRAAFCGRGLNGSTDNVMSLLWESIQQGCGWRRQRPRYARLPGKRGSKGKIR